MLLPHAPRWLAQVKSYINLDRQYGWHHLVLPMNALFSEEQMRAKLAPLVTQLGIPTATYYVDGDVWSHKHDPAAIRFAPFSSDASNAKGSHTFSMAGVAASYAYEEGGAWRYEFSDDDVRFVLNKLAPSLPLLREVGFDFGLTPSDISLGIRPSVQLRRADNTSARACRSVGDYLDNAGAARIDQACMKLYAESAGLFVPE